MSTPLLQLKGIARTFDSGGVPLDVLKDIDLTIEHGEMIAIVGASGSGKSTLMNILGCLDKPSRGQYLIGGVDVASMDADELARLRREHFGFIFQRYHLLGDLSARDNVAIPAIYAGSRAGERATRAAQLLTRLGLGERIDYRPNQLSGGQQQRVSIARALMNGGDVILADEPTGALDSTSGAEVMAILQELNAEGHTVIIVTHDMNVAQHARRIIELKDGVIIADKRTDEDVSTPAAAASRRSTQHANTADRVREAGKMAVRAIIAHKMRSFLTMLGIIIGIASVVLVVALGNGVQKEILEDISAMGTNTLDIYPGEPGNRRGVHIRTLTVADADMLAKQSFVDSVTPAVYKSVTLRYDNIAVSGQVRGVGAHYFQVLGLTMKSGAAFGQNAIDAYAPEAVIDENTRKNLFPRESSRSVVGKTILVNNMPARVVAVAADNNTAFSNANTQTVWLPYTTVMSRLLGQTYISNITVRLKDNISGSAAEETVSRILTQRHGSTDFSIFNSDSIRKTIEGVTNNMRYLISAIAVISLIVGGIGVMNIMLVSVTERTQEIGVRMAIGARKSDIMQQFLIESVLICLIGGVAGILLAWGVGVLLSRVSDNVTLLFSVGSMVGAFVTATIIGIAFGFLPARNAAELDPVVALSRE